MGYITQVGYNPFTNHSLNSWDIQAKCHSVFFFVVIFPLPKRIDQILEEKAGQPVPENLRELADAGNPGRILVKNFMKNPWCRLDLYIWRIIPFSRWLITMVSKSLNRVIPLPTGLNGL